MEYKAFISRLSVEEITIKAGSRRRALEELRKRVALEKNTGPVLHYALAKRGKLPDISSTFHQRNILSLRAAKPPRANVNNVLERLFDDLEKCWVIVEALAFCKTTEDLAIEWDESIEEVLSSRDYPDEYRAFMTYIESARRALSLPDVMGEPEEDWPD